MRNQGAVKDKGNFRAHRKLIFICLNVNMFAIVNDDTQMNAQKSADIFITYLHKLLTKLSPVSLYTD